MCINQFLGFAAQDTRGVAIAIPTLSESIAAKEIEMGTHEHMGRCCTVYLDPY